MINNTKEFYEHFARLLVTKYIDPAFESLIVSERPDLQSDELNLGIEVTQAISEEEARYQNHLEENPHAYQQRFEEVMQEINKREMLGAEQSKEMSIYRDARHFLSHYALICERIYDKLGKLNRLYRIYETNALYIFADTSRLDMVDMDVVALFIRSAEKDFPIRYDHYFIDCVETLFRYQTGSEHMEPVTMRINETRVLYRLAQAEAEEQNSEQRND